MRSYGVVNRCAWRQIALAKKEPSPIDESSFYFVPNVKASKKPGDVDAE